MDPKRRLGKIINFPIIKVVDIVVRSRSTIINQKWSFTRESSERKYEYIVNARAKATKNSGAGRTKKGRERIRGGEPGKAWKKIKEQKGKRTEEGERKSGRTAILRRGSKCLRTARQSLYKCWLGRGETAVKAKPFAFENPNQQRERAASRRKKKKTRERGGEPRVHHQKP